LVAHQAGGLGAAGSNPAIPTKREVKMKVILIGIDGLMLNRAIDSGRANKLKELKESGFHVDIQVDMPTVSGPSWSTLLTGKTIETHKVIDNYFQEHNLKAAPEHFNETIN